MSGPGACLPAELTAIDRQSLGEFEVLSRAALQDAGLLIPPEQAPMLFARVSKRLRALGISERARYCELIEGPEGRDERRNLINALTTNVTGFFREAHHFDLLAQDILPGLAAHARAGGRVRLWSAGCSSGPEPYSIAMVVLEAVPEAEELDIRILATDINPQVLQVARAGLFSGADLARVPAWRRRRFFDRLPGTRSGGDTYRIRPCLANLVSFRELNLHAPWPMRNGFDVIFCRNVMIYFDRDTRNTLWSRFRAALVPNGHLFVGHSERLNRSAATDFASVGTTTYRRLPASDGGSA
ncbi:MAG: CheR family methyltransferase [Tropicimonas sp.]|uniref:CheR family methyltransferase n=1 Tax=Tropicimonas sp. TaxID=2067044 RepID=UPI003A8418B8